MHHRGLWFIDTYSGMQKINHILSAVFKTGITFRGSQETGAQTGRLAAVCRALQERKARTASYRDHIQTS